MFEMPISQTIGHPHPYNQVKGKTALESNESMAITVVCHLIFINHTIHFALL